MDQAKLTMKRSVVAIAVIVACAAGSASAQQCSPGNWKACKGRNAVAS